MYQMRHPSMKWVEEVRGETRQEIAEAVSKVAGLLPDGAVIVDETGKTVGAWSPIGFSHSRLYGKPGIFFYDNLPGSQYLWHTEQSKAVCISS